jgi:hypothetical protein
MERKITSGKSIREMSVIIAAQEDEEGRAGATSARSATNDRGTRATPKNTRQNAPTRRE